MLSESRSRRPDCGCLIVGAVLFTLSLVVWALFAGVAIILWRLLA